MDELWLCCGKNIYGIGPTKEGAYNDYYGKADNPRPFEQCNFYRIEIPLTR